MNTILIIDDDEKLRTLVSSTLEDEGYDIRQAANGEQGIAMVRSDQPEIIICDIHMEAMSGFDVLREVRKDPSSSTIPFIFLTGMGGRSNFRQGMELGADDYIEKPFTTEELLASVRSRLRVRSIIRQESAQRLESLRSSITHALPHEFRTPLTAILALSQIIRDDEDIPAHEVRKFCGMIHTSAERLHRLVENYLLIADLEVLSADHEKAHQLGRETTEQVGSVVRKTAQGIAEQYARTGDLSVTMEEHACRISSDHLSLVTRELTDNAMKFSDEGTPVRIEGHADGTAYILTITDNGEGMHKEQIAATDLFQQHDRNKREKRGTGTGLGLSKRLLALYGGTLTLSSTPGKGTTATVSLQLP